MKGPQLSVFNFSIKNQSEESIDINIDGYIVDSPTLELVRQYWGDETSVSYKSFRDSIPSNIKTVNLFVNCSGGHVGDAMAMTDHMASLESKGVTINREGRGIVASAGTYLVMGKNSTLSENCLFMIHEVSGFAYGDVTSMENQVKAMRKFNDLIVNFYCKETGLSSTVVGNMMNAETWMTADEAKSKGFVKSTGAKAKLTNCIKPENWPFSNMAMLNTYNSFITNSNPEIMDTSKITDAITTGFNSLLEKLGISNKKDDKPIQDAFTEFSTSITNAITAGIKEIKIPDNEAITKLVNDAITNSFKTLPQNFTDAITAATKDSLKKADLDEALKNTLTAADFKKEMTTFTNSIIQKLGGASNPENGNEEIEVKNKGKKRVGNRYSGFFDQYN